MKKVFAVVGTRPDAIKMAPVIRCLKACPDLKVVSVGTGQHKEMLEQVLTAFQLSLDEDFGVMKHGQSLAYLTSSILTAIDESLERVLPDLVIAQGDTTTTFAASLAAFYRQIPFAHVEAGLRTRTLHSPFPEEMNRRATGALAELHFPPTRQAAENLLKEGVPEEKVFVAGNTSIDAIRFVTDGLQEAQGGGAEKLLLVTTHRRENWGEAQRNICKAIRSITAACADLRVVLPMHPNPTVREVLEEELGNEPRVELIEPPDYVEFAKLMKRAYLILTDSGGVQEEGPALGKPVLVLRTETERPEGISAGSALLVGTDPDAIRDTTLTLLRDETRYLQMAKARNPYGDGNAAHRIVSRVRRFLGLSHEDLAPFVG
jgi:UDP-N-acetylglucosamine 2-epimerase (non-hydrolysing)